MREVRSLVSSIEVWIALSHEVTEVLASQLRYALRLGCPIRGVRSRSPAQRQLLWLLAAFLLSLSRAGNVSNDIQAVEEASW
jgi:hypothetical protein